MTVRAGVALLVGITAGILIALALTATAKAAIHGTRGPDVIYGTPGDDVIRAHGGHDVIYGRGGNDTIWGGHGSNRIYAGPGNDFIVSLTHGREWIFCGRGADTTLVVGGNPFGGLWRCEVGIL